MFYRDAILAVWETTWSHYLNILIHEETIKEPLKSIISQSFEYAKKTLNNTDSVMEQCSIFLQNFAKKNIDNTYI